MNKKTVLLVLVVGTIIIVGVLVWLGYSKNTAIDEELMPDRTDAFKKIEKLSRPPYINKNINIANNQRVDDLLESLNKVNESNYEFNSKSYTVPELNVLGGSPRAALPYDSKVWRSKGLANEYVSNYRKTINAMLTKMSSTQVPTPARIADEALRIQTQMDQRAAIENRTTAGGGGHVTVTTGGNVSQDATNEAINNTTINAARAGWVYADVNSMFPMFPQAMYSDLSGDEVWQAQLSLWVQDDITSAICSTVQEIFDSRKLEKEDRTVLNSPIKRLVSISLGEGAQKQRTAGPGMYEPGMMEGPMGPGGGGPGGGGSYGGGYNRGGEMVRYDPNARVTPVMSLSTYASNRIFDVVNYKVTLIMPTRYLAAFQRNLMKQNYHVILNETIEPVGGTIGTGTGAMRAVSAGSTNTGDLYYYGSEAVSQVTIDGQLLLLTPFSRGLWDSKENKWIHLPLMPVSVMKALEPGAMRQQDVDLINQAAKIELKQPLDERGPQMPWTASNWTLQKETK